MVRGRTPVTGPGTKAFHALVGGYVVNAIVGLLILYLVDSLDLMDIL